MVPPGSERSVYRFAGESVRTARYGQYHSKFSPENVDPEIDGGIQAGVLDNLRLAHPERPGHPVEEREVSAQVEIDELADPTAAHPGAVAAAGDVPFGEIDTIIDGLNPQYSKQDEEGEGAHDVDEGRDAQILQSRHETSRNLSTGHEKWEGRAGDLEGEESVREEETGTRRTGIEHHRAEGKGDTREGGARTAAREESSGSSSSSSGEPLENRLDRRGPTVLLLRGGGVDTAQRQSVSRFRARFQPRTKIRKDTQCKCRSDPLKQFKLLKRVDRSSPLAVRSRTGRRGTCTASSIGRLRGTYPSKRNCYVLLQLTSLFITAKPLVGNLLLLDAFPLSLPAPRKRHIKTSTRKRVTGSQTCAAGPADQQDDPAEAKRTASPAFTGF
ncbi:hypothetical protein BHE74_00056209 [Ensete ventricosum]|nr:hypothetical protein BHE74_00056209 [Ensete ventricosum]